ncbi:hypothetical protein KIM372_08900 [Bombiscardovia nodaiensis]|uniref:Gcp-like domain-containing protein n=1 Tax=Bombiscardovia nodaiensis TaxID=2932181 RepID=A0ABM8B7Y3_9BIFI|nr:hypothetical protein KIM372_08900 [Bombiscardovia nodaiensis]
MKTVTAERSSGSQAEVRLAIDTSYGLSVGLQGFDPILEHDSHQHVELLQPTIARLFEQAKLEPQQLDTIVVCVGPAPFTGLRTGIVAAKALAFATGARLLGQDILSAQAAWTYTRGGGSSEQGDGRPPSTRRLTLAVNDARRRQLYFALFDQELGLNGLSKPLISMDIDYPDHIVERVNALCAQLEAAGTDRPLEVCVTGRGVDKYAQAWTGLQAQHRQEEDALFEGGQAGLDTFITCALKRQEYLDEAGEQADEVEPLYLRRPDISIPNPNKHKALG